MANCLTRLRSRKLIWHWGAMQSFWPWCFEAQDIGIASATQRTVQLQNTQVFTLKRRTTSSRLALVVGMLTLVIPLCCVSPRALAQSDANRAATNTSDESAADQQERVAADRFLELLKKRPRTGTALDKVYGYHVQHGSLDEFTAGLRQEAEAKNSGEAWMLLGLVSMQRGQDAEARQALEKSELLLPKEPLASFYLGRTLILLGEVDAAAQALERAIERKPARAEMLQVFQELGRLYQRMRRVDDALAVWNRMEKLFPGDTQVQEQIAVVLAEEGANAEALARFEALAKSTKDRFRKVEMAVRAAQLKEAVGRRDEALADFEKILGQVNPDSWIYQDVRNRVDTLFLNRNDYEGLAKYYTAWVDKHPDDIDAMLRIGRLLSIQRRSLEAKAWFTKAIEKAPSEPAPRLALTEALERDQDLAGAAAAMEALVSKSPDNPDYIVRWGELVFANRAIAEPERAAQAAKIWKKLLDKRGDDPVTVARVADLLRGAQLAEDAIAAYRKAVELADSEPQYREYLGEYLFQLDRKDEALTVWRELATGPRETRDNLVRLSEVYSTFKLGDEALATMAKACQLQPTFGQRTRYAEMLREAAKYDSALEQLELAGKVAESPEEHALVLEEQIKVYQGNQQLEQRIAELEAAVAGADKENVTAWQKLALYQEADRKYQQAALSIARAAELEPQSVAIHTAAVRVQERAGSFGDAIASLRKLAALDRRFLTNYLTQIGTLQMRLGQMDEALATGQQLVSASGAGSEQFRFFADLCFQAGKIDQGLDALRRNVRSNPGDREAVRLLARHLADKFQTEEAIELYWRSYALSPSLDEKRVDVEALSGLYLRTNRFDQLVSRLETSGREGNRQREATLLIAAAHQAVGDLGAARVLLEPLLREDSRDADLLGTVIKLAQAEFDWEAAARYQRRLNEVAPSSEGEYQLAKFLLDQGEITQAEAVWARLSQKFAAGENFGQMVDRLLAKGETERAVALTEQAVKREPDNWELLPLAIQALWRADKRERASELAGHLLQLQLPLDTRSPTAQQRAAKQAARPTSAGPAALPGGATSNLFSRANWLSRLSRNTFWLRAANDPFGYGSLSSQANQLTILSFRDAAAFAAIVKKMAESKESKPDKQQDAWLKEQLASSDIEQLWTAYAMLQIIPTLSPTTVVPGFPSTGAQTAAGSGISPRIQLLERLHELGDQDVITPLFTSHYSDRLNQTRRAGASGQRTPLSEAELKAVSELYEALPTKSAGFSLWLADEFKLADRQEESQRYLEKALALIEAKPNASDASALLPWDKQRATRCFVQSLAQTPQSGQGSASQFGSYFQTATFVATLLNDAHDGQDIEFLLAELKQAQAAHAKGLRPSQLAQYDPAKVLKTQIGIVAASRPITVQVDFPTQSGLQSFDLLIALRLVHDSSNQAVKEAVGKRLEQDADEPDEDVMLSAIDRLCYASWLWWSDARPAALEQMEQFQKLAVAKELGVILESRMLYELGRFDEALAMVESLRPLNQQMLQDRELAVLQLLLQKGDLTRAKQSAERLFALRLPTNVQLQLADIMNQLGMRELADNIMQRVRQRGGNDLNTQMQLMQKLVALKNDDAACEFARQILRRTQAGTAGGRSRSSDDYYRQNAVRVLVSTGQVKPMIESLEQRLEKSPNTAALILELAELYEASGKHQEAQKVLGRLAKNDSTDPRALMASARALVQAGNHADAVDKYLEAIAKQPELIEQEYYTIRTSVQQSKQWKKFAEKIEEIGVKKFARSYRMGEVISELTRNNEVEVARRLIKTVLKELGIQGLVQASQVVFNRGSTAPGSKLIDDDLRQLACDQMVSYIESKADPVSLFQRRSMTSDGHVLSTLAMLNMFFADDAPHIAKLIEKMEPVKTQHPNWLVLLAGLHVMAKDYQLALDTVKPLGEQSEDDRRQTASPIWELGSLLAHEHSQYQLTIALMEPWLDVNENPTGGRQELQYSLKGLMLFCYMKTDKFLQAKKLLDAEVASFQGDPSISAANPGYGESQVFQFRVTAAEKYAQINSPLEALLLARLLKTDQKLREATLRWNSSLQYYDQRLDETIRRARAELDNATLEAALKQLIAGPDRNSLESLRKYPAFLVEPEREESKDHKPQTTCLLAHVLQSRENAAGDKEWGEKLLAEASSTSKPDAAEARPVLGRVALICLADWLDQPDSLSALAESLVQQASANAAESAPPATQAKDEGNRSSAETAALAEARAALATRERASLWLVVDCMKRRGQKDLAVRLAQAAGTDEGDSGAKSIEQIAMRLELARLRLELGETETAEKQLRGIIEDLFPDKSEPAPQAK